MTTALIIIGSTIILLLSAYAANLLLKVRQQTRNQQALLMAQQADAAAKKKALQGDIHYIAVAMLEDRCELSEGVMRIGKLFGLLNLTQEVDSHYPSLFKHFDIIEKHPIMDARKALDKQARMKLDLARMKSEAALEALILEEVQQLAKDYAHHVC